MLKSVLTEHELNCIYFPIMTLNALALGVKEKKIKVDAHFKAYLNKLLIELGK